MNYIENKLDNNHWYVDSYCFVLDHVRVQSQLELAFHE